MIKKILLRRGLELLSLHPVRRRRFASSTRLSRYLALPAHGRDGAPSQRNSPRGRIFIYHDTPS